MRTTILAAASALALTLGVAACDNATPKTDDAAKPAAPMAAAPAPDSGPAAGAPAMPAMDSTMKAADAADDKNTAETPDGFMFHTYPNKTEMVHLPADGTWTASTADTKFVEIGAAKDEKMPDGKMHHVVAVNTKASGNATVKFEKRPAGAKPTDPATETRSVMFMVH